MESENTALSALADAKRSADSLMPHKGSYHDRIVKDATEKLLPENGKDTVKWMWMPK
jgi:hypothetical protein